MQQAGFISQSFNPQPLEPCFCKSGQAFEECCGSRAKERPAPSGVHVIHDFLDRDICRQWVEILEHQPGQPTGTRSSGDEVRINPARVTERVFLGPVEEAVTDLMRTIFSTIIPATTGVEIEWFERPQILRYAPGGHYALHADSQRYLKDRRVWQKTIDRDVSLLLYLNDDFTGGELSFYAFNYLYKPRMGDLLFFPSDHRYAHQAHEVKSGRRYVIVSWAARLGVPKVHNEPTWNSISLAG